MAVTAASLVVKVRADTSDAERSLRTFHGQLNQQAGSMARSFDGLKSAIAGFAGGLGGMAALTGLQNMAGFVQGIGQQALSTYAYTERLRMSLQSMTAKEFVQNGQAANMAEGLAMATDRAKELEEWVRKVAIASPFGREDVADALRMGMAYGFNSEQAQRLTEAMIDFTTATGQSGQVMGRATLALGQIQARGKLTAQELNQLSEAGINARQILADAFGVSTSAIMEMIEKGLVPANVAVETITASLERDFGGAASRSAETVDGLLNSLGDLKDTTLENLFGPSFDSAFKPALQEVVDLLKDQGFQDGVKLLGGELGKVAGLTLDSVTEQVERMVTALTAPTIEGTGWIQALAGLTGAQIEVTPILGPNPPTIGPIPAIAGVDTVEWNQDNFGKGEYEAEAGVVKVNWTGNEKDGEVGFVYDAEAGIRKVNWYGGDDFGDNTGFHFVYDAEAQIVKVGMGKDEDKLFQVKFTGNWREGTLVKMTEEAVAQMSAALNQTWEATVTLLPDTAPILDALAKPFKALIEWVNPEPDVRASGTNRRTGSTPTPTYTEDNLPIDITRPYDTYGVPTRARGDRAFMGGWAIVGERGPELLNLPGGTQILSNADTRKLIEAGLPGFADGTTALDPDTLKKAGAAYASGDIATYKALLGLTDAVQENTKSQKTSSKAFEQALGNVEGLFGTSRVTGQQMELASMGVPQDFADNYLRRLTDEVMNGVDWEGVDIQDAASRAGIDPNLPAEAILELFKQAWSDSSLFANSENLDLIDKGAVEASIKRQQDSMQGQANIMAMFGLTDENLTGQIEGLGAALASGLNGAIKPEDFTAAGATAFSGMGAAFSDENVAEGAMTNAASAMQSAMSAPSVASAWFDAGRSAWESFNSGFGPAAPAGGATGSGATPPTGAPRFALGGIAPGGMAWVGENGPELVDLPAGATVYDAQTSRRMGGPMIVVNATVRNDLDMRQLIWEVKRELKRG